RKQKERGRGGSRRGTLRPGAAPALACSRTAARFRHDLKSIAADAYVVKSSDVDELVRTVQSLLDRPPSR
ncbi:MAG: hypothetical protein PWP17_759, partial [Desulfomicrobiaceae bacterium]|nr:hypothetical protein [Desulfomicrobiaceae bacterium]